MRQEMFSVAAKGTPPQTPREPKRTIGNESGALGTGRQEKRTREERRRWVANLREGHDFHTRRSEDWDLGRFGGLGFPN